jgi:hypothetical protein
MLRLNEFTSILFCWLLWIWFYCFGGWHCSGKAPSNYMLLIWCFGLFNCFIEGFLSILLFPSLMRNDFLLTLIDFYGVKQKFISRLFIYFNIILFVPKYWKIKTNLNTYYDIFHLTVFLFDFLNNSFIDW